MVVKTHLPPQIQLESTRTGAVLTWRMDTYKEVLKQKFLQIITNDDTTTQNDCQDSPVLQRSN